MFLSVYGVPDGPPGIPRLSVVCHYCVPPTSTTANPYSTVPRRSPFPVVFPPFALTPVGLACSSFAVAPLKLHTQTVVMSRALSLTPPPPDPPSSRPPA